MSTDGGTVPAARPQGSASSDGNEVEGTALPQNVGEYMCVCACEPVCTFVHTDVCTPHKRVCTGLHMHMCVHACVHTCVCMYVWTFVCIRVSVGG